MKLVSLRIITEDVERLVAFYEAVLDAPASRFTPDFAEVVTSSATLAIGSARTLALFAAQEQMRHGDNRSVIVEFLVNDVDAEFHRLKDRSISIFQEPRTMPWGNRSLLFRDLDGNMVNFFTPVSPEAKKRFNVV